MLTAVYISFQTQSESEFDDILAVLSELGRRESRHSASLNNFVVDLELNSDPVDRSDVEGGRYNLDSATIRRIVVKPWAPD